MLQLIPCIIINKLDYIYDCDKFTFICIIFVHYGYARRLRIAFLLIMFRFM